MDDAVRSVLLIALFTVVGAFFAAAETALVAMRQSQAERLAERGTRTSRRLLALVNDPNRFLAAVQVGITLASFFAAAFGATQIAPLIEPWLQSLGLTEQGAATVAFILVTVVIAYFTLVIGELVPKRLALHNVERVALVVASPIDAISTVFRPFVWLLSVSTDAVMRLFGVRAHGSREQISGDELRGIVAMHEELTDQERELISEVFDAGDRELREVMVPRTEVEFLDGAMSVDKAAERVLSLPHTRYPVIRGSADEVIGFVHLRDVIGATSGHRSNRLPLSTLCREILHFPGSKQILPALTEMRAQGQHLGLVVDEYGGTAGIVTLEDLVEVLVGDIRDEYDELVEGIGGDAALREIDGLTNIEDFEDLTGLRLPDGPYETVAGFIIAAVGTVPTLGMEATFEHHLLRVVSLDGRRISRVAVEAMAVEPHDPESADAVPLPQ